MDDEKSVIKELVNSLEPHAVKDEFTKVKDKFASVCGIEFWNLGSYYVLEYWF